MEKLTFDLRIWNTSYGEQMDEQDSLDFYRTSYKPDLPKNVLDANLISLETWHRYAYDNKLLFELSVFDQANRPYASLLFNVGNAIIHFIDEYQRPYMVYTFGGEYKPSQLFLESLHYFEYEGEDFKERDESIADTEYKFTPQGKLVVYKEYTKEDGHRYESQQEAAQLVNVEKNWEPYPAFGQYECLVRLKRWGDGDLLKDIPSLN